MKIDKEKIIFEFEFEVEKDDSGRKAGIIVIASDYVKSVLEAGKELCVNELLDEVGEARIGKRGFEFGWERPEDFKYSYDINDDMNMVIFRFSAIRF